MRLIVLLRGRKCAAPCFFGMKKSRAPGKQEVFWRRLAGSGAAASAQTARSNCSGGGGESTWPRRLGWDGGRSSLLPPLSRSLADWGSWVHRRRCRPCSSGACLFAGKTNQFAMLIVCHAQVVRLGETSPGACFGIVAGITDTHGETVPLLLHHISFQKTVACLV